MEQKKFQLNHADQKMQRLQQMLRELRQQAESLRPEGTFFEISRLSLYIGGVSLFHSVS